MEAQETQQTDQADGEIDAWIVRKFGRSWKTTLHGIAVGVCGLVVAADLVVHHPVLHTVAAVCTAAGFGAVANGLRLAKGREVSGK